MTAVAMARCDYCGGEVPVAETFEPYRGATRCRDTGPCERRQIRLYDPTIPPDDDRPTPPPANAPAGAACDACREIAPPGGLYDRGHAHWRCLDRAGCQQRQLMPDLAPIGEDFPELGQSFTGAAFRNHASGAEVGADPVPLDPSEIAVLASRDAAWRPR